MVLSLSNASAYQKPEEGEENIVVIGSPPEFGTLDGVRFQRRIVQDVTSGLAVYMCFRDREERDFKVGERVYGIDEPASATSPTGVIHRIILESPAYGDNRFYYEVPKELYRDMAEHHLNAESKAQTLFSIARKGTALTLFLEGGDAAGSYAVNWIIDLEKDRVRRVVAESEQDAGPSSPWLNLKKIEKPNIVTSPNQDGPPAGVDQKPVTKAPVVDLGLQQDAMAIIRKQLALALSTNREQASLVDTVAACRRLAAPSFIIDLLGDPRYGWNRMAPNTLCYNDDFYTFVPFTYRVHEALFERWGELDLEGALKRLPPPDDDQGFDEGQVITFQLYKGAAASGKGQHAFDLLVSTHGDGSEHIGCALAPLMEGWARSDPDAAWNSLVSHHSMVNAGRRAIQGYFKGLDSNTSWEKLARKVETYCAKDQFVAGAKVKGEFRRGLASAWLRHDPAAALTWFASNCNDPHPNYGDNGDDVRVVAHAVILTEWLEDDLAGATRWLATWQSDLISTAKVLAYIAAEQKTRRRIFFR